MSENDEKVKGTPEPNIWLRHKYNPITVSGKVNIGMGEPIEFPSEAEQRKGFRVPPDRLQEVLRTYGERYVPSKDLAQPKEPRDGGNANA